MKSLVLCCSLFSLSRLHPNHGVHSKGLMHNFVPFQALEGIGGTAEETKEQGDGGAHCNDQQVRIACSLSTYICAFVTNGSAGMMTFHPFQGALAVGPNLHVPVADGEGGNNACNCFHCPCV